MSTDPSSPDLNSAPFDRGFTEPRSPSTAEDSGSPTASERFRQAVQSRQSEDEDAETDVWQGGFSSRAMFGKWLLAGFVTVLLLVAVLAAGPRDFYYWVAWLAVSALLWGGFAWLLAYRKLTCRYRLTTQRLIHEAGLLNRVTDRIEVIDIDDVTFEQRIVERMVGVGTIKLVSSDRTHPEFVMRGIENVKDVATKIDDLRRKERRRHGLHIEAI